MFDPRGNESFNNRGNLKSNIKFTWLGEISQMALRQFTTFNGEGEERSVNWCLDITDSYGFKCSFFRRGASREAVEMMMQQLPYNVTLVIEGDVNIRRGNTYFNGRFFKYPDGSAFLWRNYETGGTINEELEAEDHSVPCGENHAPENREDESEYMRPDEPF